jgi:hypothetical protein
MSPTSSEMRKRLVPKRQRGIVFPNTNQLFGVGLNVVKRPSFSHFGFSFPLIEEESEDATAHKMGAAASG